MKKKIKNSSGKFVYYDIYRNIGDEIFEFIFATADIMLAKAFCHNHPNCEWEEREYEEGEGNEEENQKSNI